MIEEVKMKTNNLKDILNQISLISLELAWLGIGADVMTHSISQFAEDAENAGAIVVAAAEHAGLDDLQVDAFPKMKVKELSRPENMNAVHEVFRILARWRDEAKAKRAVRDDSNLFSSSRRRDDRI
jgi:hypothetical protein